jgi:hypothetical protein
LFGRGLFVGRRSLLIEKREGIGRVERIREHRLFGRRDQGDVYTAVSSQNNGSAPAEDFVTLCCAQLGILFDGIFHLGVAELLIFAKGVRFNPIAGNAFLNEELLCAGDAVAARVA